MSDTVKKSGLPARLLAGQPAALARAISLVESEDAAARGILKAIYPHLGKAIVVGFTGPPGAGKSTLVNAYIAALREQGKTVGVVAVDPSSPLSGGAILGDRIRMSEHTMDSGVFIRSLASRGHLGGLSSSAARVADLMDGAGYDVVILETVGAGQSEVEMAEIADIKIVVSAPGLGDDIQAIKAGILEIADILVVNKSDLPLAERTLRQLQAMLGLRAPKEWSVPVLATNAIDRTGITELLNAVEARASDIEKRPNRASLTGRSRRLLGQATGKLVEDIILQGNSQELEKIVLALQEADIDLHTATHRVLRDLCERTFD